MSGLLCPGLVGWPIEGISVSNNAPQYEFSPGQSGVLSAVQFARVATDGALVGDTSVQPLFAADNDTLTALAATTYFFDAFIYITGGTDAHTIAFTLKGGGTATLTAINYHALHVSGTAEAVTSNDIDFTFVDADDGSGVVVTPSITSGASHLLISGEVLINAAGTLIPSIVFSADPNGTELVKVGTRLRLYPVGSNTVVSVGAWA